MANGNGKNGRKNGKRPEQNGKPSVDGGPRGVSCRRNVVSKPGSWAKARQSAYLYLRQEPPEEILVLAGISRATWQNWITCDWWWDLVQEEGDKPWFQELKIDAKRTVARQVKDPQRGEALRILESTDDRFAPPKQRLEITQNYIHIDEFTEIFRAVAQDLVDVVQDPEQRDEMVRRVEKRLLPAEAMKALPAGETEGEA